MATQITIEYNDKEYTLEFSRRTIREMEQRGFNPNDSRTMTNIDFLVSGAFRKHHPNIKPAIIENIYELIPNKEDFIQLLIEMYNEPIGQLMTEPTGDDVGKVTWKKNK